MRDCCLVGTSLLLPSDLCMEKMPSIVSVVDSIFARARSFHSLLYDDDRRRSEVETVDKQSEMDDVFSQTKKKRRKVQKSLCVNSEYANRIIDWLGKDDITTVGIYGMGGIGKTTLAVHLYNLLQNNDIPSANSHAIAWVTMEIDFTIYELQKRIAAAFGLNLEGSKDENRRAAMLCAYLSVTDNKCILFIDSLWGDFRREDVGIPRNCKLIVISRLLDVCRMLRCQKTIKVEPLSEEESWQLFQHSIAGIGVSDSIQLSHDKKLVFDECAGLPLAITALANSSMTGTINASMWREFSIESTQMEGLLNTLKLSYDRLNNIKLQRCFLYCASYSAISKEELIHLWIGEKLIDDVPSLQAQYDMGHSILNKLLNSCLLETCQDQRCIKMHDLVRYLMAYVSTYNTNTTTSRVGHKLIGTAHVPSLQASCYSKTCLKCAKKRLLCCACVELQKKGPDISIRVVFHVELVCALFEIFMYLDYCLK